MALTIVIFVLLLSLLVFVHELGHFIAAKRAGAVVEEFGFGFPPRLAGIKRGGTIYSINWIPLGGFVRIRGEGKDTHEPGSFLGLSRWRRLIVLVAGVVMNFVLAIVILSFSYAIGAPSAIDETLPASAQVRDQHVQVLEVVPNTPAEEAGIMFGDVILTVDAVPLTSVASLQETTASHEGIPQVVVLRRGAEEITLTVTPKPLPETDGRAVWGVSLVETGLVQYPWYQALWLGVKNTALIFWQILIAFWGILSNLIVRHEVPADLAGPVGIASLTGQFVDLGLSYFLQFAAILSLNLALINILPIPALDGGRVLFLVIEWIRRKPLNMRTEALIHNIGFVVLILLVTLVTARDVTRASSTVQNFVDRVFGG